VLFYDAFVFFKRPFNPLHVIAVSFGHRGYDPVIAMSLRAKKQIRNPGHYFTNAESAHRCLPQLTMCGHRQYGLGQKHEKIVIISRPPTGEESDIANPSPSSLLPVRGVYPRRKWLVSFWHHRYSLAAGHQRAPADFLQPPPRRHQALRH